MSNFLIGAKSDAGRQRSNNEDSFIPASSEALELPAVVERGLLAAVADGVGGRQAGEVASQTAVRRLYEAYYRLPFQGATPTLVEAVNEANRAVWAAAQQNRQAGMATTLAAVVVREHAVSVAYVGDSRVYLITPTAIRPLTSDHTVVNELLRSGTLTEAEAANHPQRHILSRSLGSAETVEVGGGEAPLGPDDALLLCSDGLSNLVDERTMAEMVRALSPQAAVERLVAMANAAGGADNITAVVVRQTTNIGALPPTPPPMTASGGGGWRLRWPLLGVILLSLFVLLLGAWIGRALTSTPRLTPTPTRTRTPVIAATSAPTQAAVAPIASPTLATPVPTSTLGGSVATAAGRKAILKDPWGRGQWTYLFGEKNDRTGGPQILLDGSAEITVFGMEKGNPTGYNPSASDTESRLWYRADYQGQSGWVVCPLVWFTDTKTWATCDED